MSEPQSKRRCLDTTPALPHAEFSDLAPHVIFDDILVHYVLVFSNVIDRVPLECADYSETNRSHTLYLQFGKLKRSLIPHLWTVFKTIQCTAEHLQSCAWGSVSTKHLSVKEISTYWKHYYAEFEVRHVFGLTKTKYWSVSSTNPYHISRDLYFLLRSAHHYTPGALDRTDSPSRIMPKALPQAVELSPDLHYRMLMTGGKLSNLKSISGRYFDVLYLDAYQQLERLRKIDICFGPDISVRRKHPLCSDGLITFFSREYPHLESLSLIAHIHETTSIDIPMARFPRLRALQCSGFATTVITDGGGWDSMKWLDVNFNEPQILPSALKHCKASNAIMSDCDLLPEVIQLWDSTLRFTQLVSDGGELSLTNVSFGHQDAQTTIMLSGSYSKVYWCHNEHMTYNLHICADITKRLFIDTACGPLRLTTTGYIKEFFYEMFREVPHPPVHLLNFKECRELTFRGMCTNRNLHVGVDDRHSVKKIHLVRIRTLGFFNFDIANLTELDTLHLRRTCPSLVGSLFDMLHTRREPLDSLIIANALDDSSGDLTKNELGRTKSLEFQIIRDCCYVGAPFVFDVLTVVSLRGRESLHAFLDIAESLPVLERVELHGMCSGTVYRIPTTKPLKSISLTNCTELVFKSTVSPSTVSLVQSTDNVFESPIEKLRMHYPFRSGVEISTVYRDASRIQRTDYSGQDRAYIKVNQCTVNSKGVYKVIKTVLEEHGIAVTVKRW